MSDQTTFRQNSPIVWGSAYLIAVSDRQGVYYIDGSHHISEALLLIQRLREAASRYNDPMTFTIA